MEEANKDEADRCIRIALQFANSGNKEKALKFLSKAQKLYPSPNVEELFEKVSGMSDSSSTDAKSESGSTLRNRHTSQHNDSATNEKVPEPRISYTEEQMQAVNRVKRSKDYYEILGVPKDASDSDLKRAYHKLALQMHPDKNKAPGSTEAFKAVGNAYAVLRDAEKRRRYDLCGPEDSSSPSRRRQNGHYYEYDFSRGFEGDISAEELFNMFFGGGMPTGSMQRRHRSHFAYNHFHTGRDHSNVQENNYSFFMQLLPIIILIMVSIASTWLAGEPPYSFHQTSRYKHERRTGNLRVQYFVKDNFLKEYQGLVLRLEKQIEDEYKSHLHTNCYRERHYKETLIFQARNFGDRVKLERATSMSTPSCDALRNLNSGHVR